MGKEIKRREKETDRGRDGVKCVRPSIIIDLSDRYLAKQRERLERGKETDRDREGKSEVYLIISRLMLAHGREREKQGN